MDTSEISGRIRAFLEQEFGGQGLPLTETTLLLEDYLIDSFGVIETVMFLESNFGIEIARRDIDGVNFKNLKSLSRFVAKRLAAEGCGQTLS